MKRFTAGRERVALDNLDDVLDELVDMAAESEGFGCYGDENDYDEFHADSDVIKEAGKFEKEVEKLLGKWVADNPDALEEEYDADDLYDEDGPYNILMGCNGEGVGIWDGRWDHFFVDDSVIKDLEKFLYSKLRKFADESGGGSLNEAISNAAYSQDKEATEELEEEDMIAGKEDVRDKLAGRLIALAKKMVAYGEPDFDEEFEMNDFTEKYRSDLDVREDEYGDEVATLGRRLKKELEKTYKNFEDAESEAEDLLEKLAKYDAKELKKLIVRNVIVVPTESLWDDDDEDADEDEEVDFDKVLRNIEVSGEVDISSSYSHYAITFELSLDGAKVQLEPPGYFVQDNGDAIYEGIREWDWAAWLGDRDSPMYSDTFVDAYNMAEAARTLNEIASFEGVNLGDAVNELLQDAGYEFDDVEG